MRGIILTFLIMIACHAFKAWTAEGYDIQRSYLDMPASVCDTSVCFPVDTMAEKWTFEARAALGRHGKNTAWGIGWTTNDGSKCEVAVMRAVNGNVMDDDVTDEPALRIMTTAGDSCLCDKVVSKGMATVTGYNTMTVEVTAGEVTLYAGSGLLERIAVIPGQFAPVKGCEFSCKGDVSMDYAVIEEGFPAWRKVATSWTCDSVDRYSTECEAPEGMWRYLDREMNPAVARLGGKYQVMLVSNTAGGYDIIYCSGAETHANEWRCGMLKGILTPSPFAGQYDLKWYDAQFRCHSDEAYATFSEGNRVLTLSLPLLHVTMRFARL